MVKLVPVSHDPFATPASPSPMPAVAPKLVPVSGNPFEEPVDMGDAVNGAVSNFVPDAVDQATGIYQAARHPINTLGNIGALASGGLGKLGIKLDSGQKQAYAEGLATAFGQHYADAYGGWENIKRSIRDHPVATLLDASPLLTGGGSLAARLPGTAGRVARMAAESAVIPGLKAIPRAVGEVSAQAIGNLTTHAGARSIKDAAITGWQGGQAAKDFAYNMEDAASASKELAPEARNILNAMRDERNAHYRSGMMDITGDKSQLNLDPLIDKLKDSKNIAYYEGQELGDEAVKAYEKIAGSVINWVNGDPMKFHTPEGVDALKRRIGNIAKHQLPGTDARRLGDQMYHAARDLVTEQAPKYDAIMKDYHDASDEIADIERTLSLGSRAAPETSLKKLQSIAYDNQNTAWGSRVNAVDRLDQAGGANLRAKIAGQALSAWTPRGFGSLSIFSAPAVAAGAHSVFNPYALALAAAHSPRLMGSIAHYGGRAAGFFPRVLGLKRAHELTGRILSPSHPITKSAVIGAHVVDTLNRSQPNLRDAMQESIGSAPTQGPIPEVTLTRPAAWSR